MTAVSKQPRALGVLLCYNDADMLGDAIEALAANRHDIVVWDHGSDDGTAAVLDRFSGSILERRFVERSFDFYRLYEAMSEHLIGNYVRDYDWISWPDQDEILEGPDRTKSYYDFVVDVFNSEYDWVQFNNINYWFTSLDDSGVVSPVQRIRHYSIFPDCAPRIRAWRAASTNSRHFNHNPPLGERFPTNFNLRHYPMRSAEQMERRLTKDRAGLKRGASNYHYVNMSNARDNLNIPAELLHVDRDGEEIDLAPKFNWRSLYGYS
jgi:glycosyltransferase involved in cell wall biosynthesis